MFKGYVFEGTEKEYDLHKLFVAYEQVKENYPEELKQFAKTVLCDLINYQMGFKDE